MIVTVTFNPCIDKTFSVERVLPDRKMKGYDVQQYPGGGGLNVARAASTLGAEVHALWTGGGAIADGLAGLLEQENVKHSRVPIQQEIRENLIVNDASSGQQYRFGMPGPEVTEEEREKWLSELGRACESARYVVFSGSLPSSIPAQWYSQAIGVVPETAQVIVDTKKEALKCALDARTWLIKPNVHELEDIVQRELGDDKDIEQAARSLINEGAVEVVLVSIGRGGAFIVTRDTSTRLAAPAVPVQSKVGAGDSMVAGLVTALSRDEDLERAAAFGIAAGAAAVMTQGTELCRREDTERLYRRMLKEQLSR